MLPYDSDRLLSVLVCERYRGLQVLVKFGPPSHQRANLVQRIVPSRIDPILQNESCNSERGQPTRDVIPLVVDREEVVSASWTNRRRGPIRLPCWLADFRRRLREVLKE